MCIYVYLSVSVVCVLGVHCYVCVVWMVYMYICVSEWCVWFRLHAVPNVIKLFMSLIYQYS